jgi:hypothetical protein
MITTDIDFDGAFSATAPAPAGDAPTERQLAYLGSLRTDWQRAEDELALLTSREPLRPAWVDPATKSEASDMIGKGVAAIGTARAASRVARERSRTVTEGMWIVGTLGEDGAEVYKVQQAVHGSGRLYAKLLTDEGFVFAPGVLRHLTEQGRKMTAEEGRQYGQLYGVCCRCGAQLTDEESIARGLGPVCASKF